MANYFQTDIECAPREKILALQNELLPAQVRYVWENVAYYCKKMEAYGVTPDDIKSIDDLHKLPFNVKSGLTVRAACHVVKRMRVNPLYFRHDRQTRHHLLHAIGYLPLERLHGAGDCCGGRIERLKEMS